MNKQLVKTGSNSVKIGISILLMMAGMGVGGGNSRLLAQEGLEDFSHWAGLCRTLLEQAQYEEAVAACDAAIALNTNDPIVWSDRGDALFALKQYAEAVAAYNQAIERDPNNSLLLTKRCSGAVELSQYEEAIASCDTALRMDNNWETQSPAVAWYHRGVALSRSGQMEEALTSYEWAIKINPDYSIALAGRCGILSELGQGAEALDCLRSRIASQSKLGNPQPRYCLGEQS